MPGNKGKVNQIGFRKVPNHHILLTNILVIFFEGDVKVVFNSLRPRKIAKNRPGANIEFTYCLLGRFRDP